MEDCPTGKIRHKTKAEAIKYIRDPVKRGKKCSKVARRYSGKRRGATIKVKAIKAVYCDICYGWHLCSSKKKKVNL